MSSELTRLSATELVAAYGRKDLSPLEVTQAVLDGIEAFDPQVNAFCVVDGERAIEAARTSEARWQRGEPLGLVDGVPATIKDIVLAAGWPTLRGSLAVARDQDWSDDAPATARLREHGAVLLGKTTTPEFGWKGVTDSPLTGITRNPWNTDLTPGGSSGGAAAACALGLGALHVGTDGGGSIRIPAGFTGIFGLKATFGRVPAWPSSPFGTVAHVGPLTRTVTDAALMLSVLAEPDTRDWHALPASGRDYRVGLEDGVRGLRIAFSPDLGHVDVDPEVTEAVARAAHAFTELGAHVEGGATREDGYRTPGNRRRRRAHYHCRVHAGDVGSCRPRRAHGALSRELGSAAFTNASDSRLRSRHGISRGGGLRPLARLDAVHLPFQPDAAAGRIGAVRVHRRRRTHRHADRGRQVRRCTGAARGAIVRIARYVQHARRATITEQLSYKDHNLPSRILTRKMDGDISKGKRKRRCEPE
jgi:Asp-tRNA(Asn)/Glu-tRNA(Gln) amidotransferase A subunit family amidase